MRQGHSGDPSVLSIVYLYSAKLMIPVIKKSIFTEKSALINESSCLSPHEWDSSKQRIKIYRYLLDKVKQSQVLRI